MRSFTFNGIKKPWVIMLRGRQKAPFAPLRRNLLVVPGMPGAYLQSTDVEPIVINQPIGFKADDDIHALQLKDELAEWLVTDEPVPLEFDDEPGRTYYAVVQNTIDDFEKFAELRQGTIQFLCLDPYGYGPELEATFPSDVVALNNNGTAEADPIFDLEVLQPVTFAMIQNQDDEYMMIGRPINVDENTPYTKYERIFYSDANSLAGWTTAVQGEIDGTISGSMESNGTRFQAASYGTGSGWHGPAIKTSLSEVLTDFQLDAFVSLYNKDTGRVGRVEVYLLDVNGNQIGKVAMKDTYVNSAVAWGEARAGSRQDGYHLINEYGSRPGVWNEFYGILRLKREGNHWSAYFAKQDPQTRVHHTRKTASWYDTENKYTGKLAQIVVHMGQMGSYEPIVGGVYSVIVQKINPEQPNEVPYIAQPGDIITFDHRVNDLLINGESRKDIKDFGATYFKLKKGENTLIVHPSETFDVTCRYRERFK